ncbi:MAG: sortase [Candidatus Peregrinibacteria bacterium]
MIRKPQIKLIAYFLACTCAFISLVAWQRASEQFVLESIRQAERQTPGLLIGNGADDPELFAKIFPRFPFSWMIPASLTTTVERDPGFRASGKNNQWCLSHRYALSIPTLQLSTDVLLPCPRYWNARDWDLLERQMQAGLTQGVVAYPHSVQPGQRGSLIIVGHSSPLSTTDDSGISGRIFSRVPELKTGDQIIVRNADRTFTYVVYETSIVNAEETSLLEQQQDASQLTLITCYPVGSTKQRFIVKARFVHEGEGE